jgi:hypothetical protein
MFRLKNFENRPGVGYALPFSVLVTVWCRRLKIERRPSGFGLGVERRQFAGLPPFDIHDLQGIAGRECDNREAAARHAISFASGRAGIQRLLGGT